MADSFQLDPSRVLDRLRASAADTIDRVTEAIRPHAPVSKGNPDRQGGGLQAGLAGKVQQELSEGIELAVTSDKPYTQYVIRGTQPHVIEARTARALRFWVEGDNLVFAKRVNHPGTQPNPFYHQADDQIREIVWDNVRQAMTAALHP